MLKSCFQNRSLAVLTNSLFFKIGTVCSDFFNFRIDFCNTGNYLLNFLFNRLKLIAANLIRGICGINFMLLITKIIRKFIDFIKPYTDFKRFSFFGKLDKFSCLFTLLLKRTNPAFKLAENIKQTNKIFLRLIKPSLRICSFMAKTGYTCRFLKKLSPILIFSRDNGIYFTLSNHRIAIRAKTGIHKEFVDILASYKLAVYFIFTLAASVISSHYSNDFALILKRSVTVIKSKLNLCKAKCLTGRGSAEDNILHLGAAK